MKIRVLCVAAGALVATACGASRESAYEVKAAATAESVDGGLQAKAEALWEKRGDTASLKEAMEVYEQLAAQQPENRALLSRLARGYYLLGYGHLKAEEEVLQAHHKGASWGERILGLRPEFRQKLEEGAKDYEALDVATAEDVPGIYWAYANLARWSVIKGFTTVLKNKTKLKSFIDRVAALQPDFYHGAADRGLGAFYAKAPSFAGGDLDKSRTHFDRSLEAQPNYFGTKVLMAEFYAVKQQDRKLFEDLLKEVVSGDPNSVPDAFAIQDIEQRRAKDLLAKAEDFFE